MMLAPVAVVEAGRGAKRKRDSVINSTRKTNAIEYLLV